MEWETMIKVWRDFHCYISSCSNIYIGFWALTTMSAAELKFPNPPANQPQWLALAQAVFNVQATKIDGECGGGLRWQAFAGETGIDYKNSIANGCFFQLGARLAAYTGNSSYATYAENTWTWMRSVGFMDDDYNVYDGAHVETGCTDINRVQYSYNSAIFVLGAATMYSYVSLLS
jgi:mannan endo-1,6-alpha-mannosidase